MDNKELVRIAADIIEVQAAQIEDLQVARIVAENPGIDPDQVRESLRGTNG